MDADRIIRSIGKFAPDLAFFLGDERKTPAERASEILCYYSRRLAALVGSVPLAVVFLPPFFLLPKPHKEVYKNWLEGFLEKRHLLLLERRMERETLKLDHLTSNPHHNPDAAIRQQHRLDEARRAFLWYADVAPTRAENQKAGE